VMDPNGAVIIEATVTAKNVDTGVETVVQTNQEGIYRFASLAPGNYEFTVSKHGFKVIVKPGATLHLADTISLNFSMMVGAVTESVTVQAGVSNINTTDASISTVVDQSYVANMPLNGRSFQDLILLTPGVTTRTPQAPGSAGASGEFSVNGQRTEENYYTVDGVSANIGAAIGQTNGFSNTSGAGASGGVQASTALGTTQSLVSVDELQEFRVESSTYSAEYGRFPGGQIAFQTKSGTNQWHGSAYDYLRNGYFDAQDWFSNYLKTLPPPLHQHDFGGTLGGAIQKDKTFFFMSYEGLRLTAPQPPSINVVVPDAALRAGAPAPVQAAVNAYPLPTPGGVDNPADNTAQFIASWSNPGSIDSTSVRFDHVVKDKLKLFLRFNNTGSSTASRPLIGPSIKTSSNYTTRTYTSGVTTLFSSRLTNDFRLNYSSNEPNAKSTISPIGGGTPIDLLQLSGLNAGAEATFCYVTTGGTCIELDQAQWSAGNKQWNLVDTVSLSLGRHQLKFGADYRRTASGQVVATPSAGYRFNSQTDIQNNTPQTLISLFSPAYPLYKNFSAFGHDEWHVSPRLTLSIGLRWDVNPAPGVTQGLMPYTLMGTGLDNLTFAPQGTPLWKTTWYNFAPRLGAAYVLRTAPGWETVLRSGGGVFFSTGQQLGSLAFEGPGFASFGNDVSSASVTFPTNIPAQITASGLMVTNPPGPGGLTAFGYSPHLQLPYTLQWNAGIEQALGKTQALTVSYVGSHASRLLQQNTFLDFNNQDALILTLVQNGLTSDYGALETQFRRNLSHGLTALGSYTWSHCIDYGSSSDLQYQRGVCDFDVRHNFSGAFSYSLPNAGHGGWMGASLNHWGIDDRFTARTAFPVNLAGFASILPDGREFTGALDFVPGQPVYVYGANCNSILQAAGELLPGQGCPGGKALNPNAFTPSPSCGFFSACFGTVPRNFGSMFGAWQMDLAIRREFPIGERMKVQFRAEAFNVFNHANFGTVDSGFGDIAFGLATASLAGSQNVLSPLYALGGPRSMQFALKVIF